MLEENRPKRWYEKNPDVHRAVLALEKFPDEIQTIIARGVMLMAFKWFKADDLLSSFKSVGKDKVLGLHKSKNKRRPYDQNPELHKAMSYMYVLTSDEQDFIARKIISLSRVILEYLKLCHQHQAPPRNQDVETFTQQYVEEEEPEEKARQLLRQIADELERHIIQYKAEKKDGQRLIGEGDQGLVVREEDTPPN